jgi:phospholipase D1/2
MTAPNAAATESLFRPGENCGAVARAARVSFLVDAEDYFQAFVHAAEKAEHSILILAWDFDSRTPLGRDSTGKDVTAGEFLNRLAAQRRGLRIRILDWDFPIVYGTDRELPPTLGVSWKPHRRIDFRFDDTHPFGGSHHQKIVVIDDHLAFSGGLDFTNKRWDTREHKADDSRRVFNGEPYPPFHDVMIGVDGEAAEALAKVARERWHAATGQRLKPVKARKDPWPEQLPVHLTDVAAGVSCTYPPRVEKGPGVHHVEALYLDMIERARKYIYIENQYFTSEKIGAALARRLAEPDGPEIVVVTRLLSHGWLEEITMTTLRTQLVRKLREADAHGHFRVYYPDVPGLCEGTCLDIHSKVMIVDDEWLRIGSANLSNRSMGMDTECDVTLEAKGEKRVQKVFRDVRDGLLAEHLGCEVTAVAREVGRRTAMAAAVQALALNSRCLKELEAPEIPESKLAVAKVGDPEAPILEGIVKHISPVRAAVAVKRLPLARAVLAAIIVVAIALALVWTKTPLADVVTRDNAMEMARVFADKWWAPLLVVLLYTPASFIMFPRWAITMTAVIAFGPWEGFAYAMSGVILAAIATFLPGRLVALDSVQRLLGPRLKRLTQILQKKGLIAVTLVRLVPVAPFPLVNLAMGAMRVSFRDFVAGTFLGMLPGMLAATVLSDQLAAALENPASVNLWLIAAALLVLGAFAFFGQRWLRRQPA